MHQGRVRHLGAAPGCARRRPAWPGPRTRTHTIRDLVGAEAVSIYNEAAPAPSSVRPQVRDAPSLPLRGLIGQLLCSAQGYRQGVCDGR